MNQSAILIYLISIIISLNQGSLIEKRTFSNPLFQAGADPWIIFHNGWYYYTTSSRGGLAIKKAKNLNDFKASPEKVIWVPPQGTGYSKELWAPELHFILGKWYVYFAADNGSNKNHRVYVIENSSEDPQEGTWEFRGKVSDPSDKWAIDASIINFKGKLYMIWSGWEGDVNGQQNIYIAAMKNPWTIEGKRVLISRPDNDWEKIGDLNSPNDVPHVNVNEGPVALIHNRDLFIVYSASGCWTDTYCLGMLTYKGKGSLLDPLSWVKKPKPVFIQSPENGVYGPGHNSFFKSPDGTEDWILYHANPKPGQGCGRNRSPRAQKFTWNKDGSPYFGIPVSTDIDQEIPSEKAGK